MRMVWDFFQVPNDFYRLLHLLPLNDLADDIVDKFFVHLGIFTPKLTISCGRMIQLSETIQGL